MPPNQEPPYKERTMPDFDTFMNQASERASVSVRHPRPFHFYAKFMRGIDRVDPYGCDANNPHGYEPELMHLLDLLVPDDGTFLDVGANRGYFSAFLGTRPGFNGVIHAFEPVNDTHIRLVGTIRSFGCAEIVRCHRVGISDRRGKATIERHPHDSGQNRISEGAGEGEVVPTERLDDLDLGKVDFIKIDVEGHEIQALQGATQLLARDHPFVWFEHWFGEERDIGPLELLRSLDYELFLPVWLQSDGSLFVGLGAADRDVCALLPFAPEVRGCFPNAAWNPTNIFACHRDRRSEIGSSWDGVIDSATAINRAAILQHLKRYDAAIEAWHQAMEGDPENAVLRAQAFVSAAIEAEASGDQGSAAHSLAIAARAAPSNMAINRRALDAHLKRGDLRGSLIYVNRLVELMPGDPRPVISRAEIFERLEDWNSALADFDRAIVITENPGPMFTGNIRPPKRPDLHYRRAVVLLHLGRRKEANDEMRSAVRLSSGSEKEHMLRHFRTIKTFGRPIDLSLGMTVIAAVKTGSRIVSYVRRQARLYGILPNTPDDFIARGEMHMRKGNPLDAISDFTVALEKRPKDVSILSRLLMAHVAANCNSEALADANAALSLEPDDINLRIQRAGVFQRMERWEEALADYEVALTAFPDRADIRSNRDAVLGRCDQLKSAA